MISGRCLCGKVSYQYDGGIEEIAICHCSQCRKAQGSAFATNSPIETDKLKFTGQQYTQEYQSSENKIRAFCKICGSPLYSTRKDIPDIRRLRLGTIETQFTCNNKYHIFSASKASWYEITDDAPQFEKHKNK